MEQLFSATKGTKGNVFTDPSHRMSQRPLAVKSGEGLGFQDFGSSFGPPKPVNTYGRSHDRKYKATTALHEKSRKLPCRILDDDSDDELLLSSQNSVGSYATSSPKRVAKGKKPCKDEETVRVNGRALAAHPDFKPSSLDAIKGLRFTKTKKLSPSTGDVTEGPPPSSLPGSQDLLKPISDDIEIVDDSRPGDPSSRQKPFEASLRHCKSPTTTCAPAHQTTDVMGSCTSKPSPSIMNDTQRKARPRPRVVIKFVSSNRDSSPESTPRPAPRKRDIPPSNKTSEQHTNTEGKRTTRKPTLSSSRREPQELPLLQARENLSDDARSDDTSSKIKKAPISRFATFGRGPKPIPLPSPLRAKPVSRESTFPNLSPLSSSKQKGKARARAPEDDANLTDGPGKRVGPKPFPMSSQMLAGIDRRSKSPAIRSHKSAKRASSDDSGVEQGHSAKKRKDSRSGLLDSLDYLHEPMEDDSLELGYARDPSKMCPYCDEDFPSHPTPFLQHLLATARKKAIPDPRPKNRGGLKAPLTVYVSVCQRHRFELHQLPIATEKGWPKTIDFSKVPARVKKMKKALEDIILDKDDTSDIENLDIDGSRGPRTKSVFWKEVKKEVKKQGSRTVTGVKGQFASFEKTQPGYYGELGSVIIHQTLFDLFPPSTFDPFLIAPLAPAEFIQRVLVPEAAVRLIAQDLCVDIEDAVVTLRESAQYGVSMFPDTSETKRKGTGVDNDEMGVADRIVMERARARRKELAEEEKLEEVILEEERAAQRARARESRREKALERAKQAKEAKAHVEDRPARDPPKVPDRNAAQRTRRETRQRTVTDDSESDAMSVDSLTSRRSARIANKGVRGDGENAVPQLDGSDSDIGLFNDSRHKPRNGKRNTKERSTDPSMHLGTETITPRERTKPLSGLLAPLDNDENTPRPVRGRKMTMTIADVAAGSERPLQVVRNRIGTSTRDGWLNSLRTGDDTDSNMSTGSRRSIRPPMRKGTPINWLFSDPSPSDSS